MKTEQNTPAMHAKVLAAARQILHKRNIQADFEHGQWWITVLGTSAQYSVVDAEGGRSVNGFDLEQVSEGDSCM